MVCFSTQKVMRKITTQGATSTRFQYHQQVAGDVAMDDWVDVVMVPEGEEDNHRKVSSSKCM